MTQAELILKLIEQLLTERDKNNNLQSKLEEQKKGKDQMCHYIVESGKVITGTFLLFQVKKSSVLRYTTGKQYTQAELEYIA